MNEHYWLKLGFFIVVIEHFKKSLRKIFFLALKSFATDRPIFMTGIFVVNIIGNSHVIFIRTIGTWLIRSCNFFFTFVLFFYFWRKKTCAWQNTDNCEKRKVVSHIAFVGQFFFLFRECVIKSSHVNIFSIWKILILSCFLFLTEKILHRICRAILLTI